jgi:hypothetical protein
MRNLTLALLRFAIAGAALFSSFLVTSTSASADEPICGDTRIPIESAILSKPFANLRLGGNSGSFLIDTGATQSQVETQRYGLPAGSKIFLSGFSLPSVQGGVFTAAELRSFTGPQGTPLGTIGTDFLSLHSIEFHYGQSQSFAVLGTGACDKIVLRRAGFVSVGLPGYYAADVSRLRPGMPNVPVIGLRIGQVSFPAQVDTGYGDLPQGVIQVNAALMNTIRAAGIKGHAVPSDIATVGCSGTSAYERWQTDYDELSIVTEEGIIVASYQPPLLEVKTGAQCSGISIFAEPFAQIGASWLLRWGTSVFDGLNSAVWIPTALH